MLHVFYSDMAELPLPDKHAFPKQKYALTRRLVQSLAERRGNPLGVTLRPGPRVTREELLRVHTPEYIDAVFTGTLTERHQRAIGFPWSEGFVQRQLHSTGATLAAARAAVYAANGPATAHASGHAGGPVIDQATWGAHLAGGTHHAFADRGQGFCVFNDVAVAIRTLRAEGRIDGALVIDCDVHQGNGTAALFRDDPRVFTFSIHGAKNFPLKKEASDLDVPLPDGCGDEEYLRLLGPALDRVFAARHAVGGGRAAIFYLAGADPFVSDKYGRMKLTKPGLRERDRRVLTRCRAAGLPTTVVLGGGYARDVNDIAEIYAATIEEAAAAACGSPSG
ncbi:MAG: histone deacetylase [Planctomycetota bacterium]